ncbi:hypothetical protein GCM10011351_17240 [Paraliobacillus quinghaiensis]|uniref:ComG operon protein 7 n=1 Tax=Paraliobacillus quinghaiensis TaxID=470815 RepID=A0A917TQG3_9BACI|nr:hypothetical protein [Paraliobacillus quinghaiensis]GGM31606.1 hypothetical protein GCM10011351_17240 [Paraliobacillus quinghaiensis]
MQKHLVFIKHRIYNQDGFLLPYVTFIITLLLLSVMSAITLYSNDQLITELQLEQVELETLHQIGYTDFSKNLVDYPITTQQQMMNYFYPNGKVLITYYQHNDNKIVITLKAITLKKNQKTRVYYLTLE